MTVRSFKPRIRSAAFSADQHARRVGMTADDGRHDRSICHPQPVNSADAQLRIHHAGVIMTHPVGADWGITGVRPTFWRRQFRLSSINSMVSFRST